MKGIKQQQWNNTITEMLEADAQKENHHLRDFV